eukprot:g22216.t1
MEGVASYFHCGGGRDGWVKFNSVLQSRRVHLWGSIHSMPKNKIVASRVRVAEVLNGKINIQLALQIKGLKDQLRKILGEENIMVGAEPWENQAMTVHLKEIIAELERHAETVNVLIQEEGNAFEEAARNK